MCTWFLCFTHSAVACHAQDFRRADLSATHCKRSSEASSNALGEIWDEEMWSLLCLMCRSETFKRVSAQNPLMYVTFSPCKMGVNGGVNQASESPWLVTQSSGSMQFIPCPSTVRQCRTRLVWTLQVPSVPGSAKVLCQSVAENE